MLESMKADRALLLDSEPQILDRERSPSALSTERALAQERLDAYKYPVLTIPNEITSEIFIRFLPIYPDAPPLTGPESPTTLTHVCRQWREVALATPALWRAMRLDYKPRTQGYTPMKAYAPIQYLSDAWIRRSGSCPLSIEIHDCRDVTLLDVLTETMAMAAARFEHLVLWIPSHSLPKIGRMPLLRSLSFWARDGSKAFASHTPQLRTVSLFGGVVPNIALPWAQLTCLTLDCIGIKSCVSILRKTKNLIRCDLRFSFRWGESVSFSGPDLVLPRLNVLILKDSRLAVDSFLTALVVPRSPQARLEGDIPW
ncbi:WD40 repeat-like protein [Mycena sanguinolenta]|uniref:WD40 repeat-like protein n=1 Tax=Mycena sanguinolenta TaxID=230812 RepID=A0A8H7DIJ8_9AGAR|nr:WD40 repeat-like protein [Mycena sanguinolenta]